MIEIIPNWHPIFVHFTIALLSLAVGFHIICHFLSEGKLKQQFYILARWDLWLGTGFGIITAIAGWLAYNSVAHDAPSHEAMTDHRNWALVTIGLFIILAGWSLWSERQESMPSKLFLTGLLIGGVLLANTAWHGAENVYRYGLGVMSLPQAETGEDGHDHGAHTEDTTSIDAGEEPVDPGEEPTATHGHDHGAHTEDTISIDAGEEPVDLGEEPTATHGHHAH